MNMHVTGVMLDRVIDTLHMHLQNQADVSNCDLHLLRVYNVHFTVVLCVTYFLSGCEFDEFSCLSGECISDYWNCDGWEDCEDGSDEFICDGE